MAFDCVRGQEPGYFDDVFLPVCAELGSADQGNMVITCSRTLHFGQCGFRLSAPAVQNDLL